jgi:hypothetical protein
VNSGGLPSRFRELEPRGRSTGMAIGTVFKEISAERTDAG